jgi:hypothetical protein
MIVARHEVPGKASPERPSRRVRYDRRPLIAGVFLVESASLPDVRVTDSFLNKISSVFKSETSSFHTAITESKCAHLQDQTVPYARPEQATARRMGDGDFGVAIPRHFVPGYDRTVPPGQKTIRPCEASLS